MSDLQSLLDRWKFARDYLKSIEGAWVLESDRKKVEREVSDAAQAVYEWKANH